MYSTLPYLPEWDPTALGHEGPFQAIILYSAAK